MESKSSAPGAPALWSIWRILVAHAVLPSYVTPIIPVSCRGALGAALEPARPGPPFLVVSTMTPFREPFWSPTVHPMLFLVEVLEASRLTDLQIILPDLFQHLATPSWVLVVRVPDSINLYHFKNTVYSVPG